MKQTWTVYSNVGRAVFSQRWTEEGPQGSPKLIASFSTIGIAETHARNLQTEYDGVRRHAKAAI